MIGTSIGPYRILAELGRGGMGTVYVVEATTPVEGIPPGAQIALKVFHPHYLGNAEILGRFLQEARLGSSIRHPNVVRTFEGGTAEDPSRGTLHYLAMELVEGQTLRDLLREIGPFPEPLALLVARQVAAALEAIHAAGIVHRDVKPENLLVTRDHRVKVMDLGVARIREESVRLTRTGEFLGSLPYASPEQLTGGDDVDGRADIYALGVVLYECLTGRNPFVSADPLATMRRHLEEIPEKPGILNPQISHVLEELVMTCLEKKPQDRFRDARGLLEALEGGAASAWWQARQTMALDARGVPVRRLHVVRETAVHGRERELGALRRWFHEAASGRGRVALLVGEAGIGKTRLVDELAASLEAERANFQFLHGSTPPEGPLRPLQPFSEALVDWFAGVDDLEEALVPLLRRTPVLLPAFAAFLRGAPPPAGAEPLTRDSVLTVAADALRTFAEDRPTILVVDDLHFADEETRRLFAYLARQAPDLRLLLVGTARPEQAMTEYLSTLERMPLVERLDVSRLGAREAVALLREVFGSERAVQEVGLRVLEKADGNPFFLFEIVRGLKERGAIEAQADGTYAARLAFTAVDVPSTVKDILLLRLQDLDEDDMDLLRVAAVQGFEFDPDVAGDALGVERLPLLKRLGRLERRHRVVRHLGYRYRFDHHLIRETLYEDMAPGLLEEYHRLVGEALRRRAAPPEVVAGHFFRSNRPDEGIRDLLPGLHRLRDAFQNDAGVELSEQGLQALPAGADPQVETLRFEVLLLQAAFLDRLGRRDRQEQALEEARRVADRLGGPERAIRIFDRLSGMFANTGRFEEARRAAESALAAARGANDRRGEAKASMSLGMVAWNLGRPEEALALYERSLVLARELADRAEEADVLNNLGAVAQSSGDYEHARRLHEEALEIQRGLGNRYGEARSLSNLGIVAYHLGRYEEARRYHERALDIRRQVGDRHGESSSLNNLGAVAHYLGLYDEARAYHEQALALKRQIGDRAGEATSLNNLGNVAYAVGRYDEAERMHAMSSSIRREIGDVRGQAASASNLGVVVLELGRLGEARDLHERSLALNREVGDLEGAATALACLGSLATARGDFEAAQRLLEESRGVCRSVSDTRGESYALAGLAELARQRGDAAGASVQAEKALELRRGISYSNGVLTSCLQLSDLLQEVGGGEVRARGLLEEAVHLAGKLGAKGYEALARARLALLDRAEPPGVELGSLPPSLETEVLWALLRLARARGDASEEQAHRLRLRALLEKMAASLPAEEREAFWTRVTPNRLVR